MAVSLPTLRKALFGAAIALCTGLSNPVWAACERTYTSQALTEDLGVMTNALRDDNQTLLITTGGRMEAGLPCIRTKVPAQVFASAYRFIGASQFAKGKRDRAGAWFRASLELSPTFEFDVNEVPMGSPLRQAFDAERGAAGQERVAVEGKELNLPAGSVLFLDGRKLTRPEASLGRPHLLQVIAESDNTVRQAFVIEGNAIPDQYLRDERAEVLAADGGRDAKPEKGQHQPNYDLQAVKIKRVRPAAKTPLMLAGGAVALGSAGIYAASFSTRAKFDAAGTTADLERYQQLTNTLVIASGATLLVGLGVEYAGIMLGAGGNGIRMSGRF